MSTWTSDELDRIGGAEELELASVRRDGTLRKPVTIWVARHGDDLYVRSVYGGSSWFRGVEECPDLAESGDGEVHVVCAGERPEQGYAFQAEEVRQRVLIDHGRVDAGNTHRSCEERRSTGATGLAC